MTYFRYFYILLFLSLSTSTLFSADCPGDAAGWRQWATREIEGFWSNELDPGSLVPAAELWDRCAPARAHLPKVDECLGNFSRFAHAVSLQELPEHSLGVVPTDEDYFAKVPFPEMMELPERLKDRSFLQRLDHNEDPKAMNEALRWVMAENEKISDPSLQWQTFIYRSRHLATPDATDAYGRFFIFVPGKEFDRYFQFGLRDSLDKELPHGLSVATVLKVDPKTHAKLREPEVRLKDFWRLRPADGSYPISTRLKEKGSLENCYGCHKDPVLPIHPDRNFFDEKRFGKALELVNERITRLRSARYVGLDMEAYGPTLGPKASTIRTPAFLAKCAGSRVTPARLARLGDAMNCASCHNGKRRGLLNFPSAIRPLSIGETLPWHYVVKNAQMPPESNDLTAPEREALFDCLKREYYADNPKKPGLLREWLENAACWPVPTK